MQAKDIPEQPILEFLFRRRFLGLGWASHFENCERSVRPYFPENTPENKVMYKMRSMINRGLVSGCWFSCIGDYEITNKGIEFLKQIYITMSETSKVVLEQDATAAKARHDYQVTETKQLRKDTDAIIQRVKDLVPDRETSLAITKLQEGVMWLGMHLKALGEANPYPNSKDPSNTLIEPTADNLKL